MPFVGSAGKRVREKGRPRRSRCARSGREQGRNAFGKGLLHGNRAAFLDNLLSGRAHDVVNELLHGRGRLTVHHDPKLSGHGIGPVGRVFGISGNAVHVHGLDRIVQISVGIIADGELVAGHDLNDRAA